MTSSIHICCMPFKICWRNTHRRRARKLRRGQVQLVLPKVESDPRRNCQLMGSASSENHLGFTPTHVHVHLTHTHAHTHMHIHTLRSGRFFSNPFPPHKYEMPDHVFGVGARSPRSGINWTYLRLGTQRVIGG